MLAGNDLTKMNSETVQLLTNREVIAVDQDPLGKQGDRVSAEGPMEIWAKPLSGGAEAVGLFNRGEDALSMTLHLRDIGLSDSAKCRDLWTHKDVACMNGIYTVLVPRHGAVMLKVSGQ